MIKKFSLNEPSKSDTTDKEDLGMANFFSSISPG